MKLPGVPNRFRTKTGLAGVELMRNWVFRWMRPCDRRMSQEKPKYRKK
jgi:hypothetical protein